MMTLTVSSYGCDTTVFVPTIVVLGPIIGMEILSECRSLDAGISFYVAEAESWQFSMGSIMTLNGTSNFDTTFTYNFPDFGGYPVTLTAYDEETGCSDVIENAVALTNISAVITPAPLIGCPGMPVYINSWTSDYIEEFDSEAGTGKYHWSFGDGEMLATNEPYVAHNYEHPGTFTLSLVIFDGELCYDTAYTQVNIYYLEAQFSSDVNGGCIPFDVQFTDQTIHDTTIVSWHWYLGNGEISDESNPFTSYSDIDEYDVTLEVMDAAGCTSSHTVHNYITSSNPYPMYEVVSPAAICAGDSVHFNNTSVVEDATIQWDFGDGEISTINSPWHVFEDGGEYIVTLYVSDAGGCDTFFVNEDIIIDVDEIPEVLFSADPRDSVCYPLLVDFSDLTTAGEIAGWSWTFGDGATSVFENPVHNYTLPGDYNVSLVATTPNGCNDSLMMINYIHVGGPYAEFVIDQDSLCYGQPVNFQITLTSGVDEYYWDFGDGSTSTGSYATHVYTDTSGLIYPALLYTDSMNYCPKASIDSVYIFDVDAAFGFVSPESGLPVSEGCEPLNVLAVNNSTGADYSNWNFGDGSSATDFEPGHTFNNDGLFTVTLSVENFFGCTDEVTGTILIFPLPVIIVTGGDLICSGDTVHLSVSGDYSFAWENNGFISDTLISNPFAFPDSTAVYTVTATDENNCSISGSTEVLVQDIPFINFEDTSLFIGEEFLFDSEVMAGVSYLWTPPNGLSCTDCPNPIISTQESMVYTVVMTDSLGCYTVTKSIIIEIMEDYTVAVPSAFTPNGDGSNDIIYVMGHGIEELLEFSIYNRWGQLLFRTDDINKGWDGYYNGQLQNIETYSWTATAKTYAGTTIKKQGMLNLLR